VGSFNVSVVIPVYNAEKYVKRAVESVLIQPEVTEVILVNDGSSDNSVAICQKLQEVDQRIIIVHHLAFKNKGVSASRNLGIKTAKNNFIAFLDSDDYYLPKRFLKTKICFEEDDNIDGVYELIGVHSDSHKINEYAKIDLIESCKLFENMQPIGSKVWFSNNGITLKKVVFKKCGYFDEKLKTSEDTLQWFKMASVCKLVPGEINDFVALSEKLTNGLSSNRRLVEKDFIIMLLKLFKFCESNNLTASRKELVVSKLLYFISIPPYNEYFNGLNKLKLFAKIISVSPSYLIFQSSSFRLAIGNFFNNKRFFLFR
jgi:glycosyltransferase involved in cell wall biosynthesis